LTTTFLAPSLSNLPNEWTPQVEQKS